MTMKVKTILAFMVLALASCAKPMLRPSELIAWVKNESNGLVQKQSLGGYDFELMYKPIDYVIAMEGRTDELTEERYVELKNEMGGMQYIDLRIKTAEGNYDALSGNIETQEDYYARLDYFVTYAYRDIWLVQGTDTLSPQLYHFERTYGLTPYNTILLGFEMPDASGDRSLIIDEQALGIGRIKFVFEEEKINNTPTLKRI